MRHFHKLLCKIFWHKALIIVHKCNETMIQLYCPRCNDYFAINYQFRIMIPWKDEFCDCPTLAPDSTEAVAEPMKA